MSQIEQQEKCACCMYPQCSAEPFVMVEQRRGRSGMYCKPHAVCVLLSKIQNMQQRGFAVYRYRKCMMQRTKSEIGSA